MRESIYIYIYRERERESDSESERERESESERARGGRDRETERERARQSQSIRGRGRDARPVPRTDGGGGLACRTCRNRDRDSCTQPAGRPRRTAGGVGHQPAAGAPALLGGQHARASILSSSAAGWEASLLLRGRPASPPQQQAALHACLSMERPAETSTLRDWSPPQHPPRAIGSCRPLM